MPALQLKSFPSSTCCCPDSSQTSPDGDRRERQLRLLLHKRRDSPTRNVHCPASPHAAAPYPGDCRKQQTGPCRLRPNSTTSGCSNLSPESAALLARARRECKWAPL